MIWSLSGRPITERREAWAYLLLNHLFDATRKKDRVLNFFGDEESQSLMYSVQIRYALTWCAEDVCLHCHFKLWCIIVFSEEQFPHDGNNGNPELLHSRSLSKDLQGAPPGSFIHHLAEVIGSISSVHKMAFFWQSVVLEVSIMQINCPS